MIDTILPPAPELWAMVPPREQGLLAEQLATLWRENAAL
jgi:hypothetical protein